MDTAGEYALSVEHTAKVVTDEAGQQGRGFAQQTRPEQDAGMRALLRLSQLSDEIQDALQRGDMVIVDRAAGLLAPALEEWYRVGTEESVPPTTVTAIADQTCRTLAACTAHLEREMVKIDLEMRSLRRGKRLIAVVKDRRTPSKGRRLDSNH